VKVSLSTLDLSPSAIEEITTAGEKMIDGIPEGILIPHAIIAAAGVLASMVVTAGADPREAAAIYAKAYVVARKATV
jgi:hypothetical protein